MNDRERELWVLNNEYLYFEMKRWRRTNKGGMRGFIRANREMIDQIVASREFLVKLVRTAR